MGGETGTLRQTSFAAAGASAREAGGNGDAREGSRTPRKREATEPARQIGGRGRDAAIALRRATTLCAFADSDAKPYAMARYESENGSPKRVASACFELTVAECPIKAGSSDPFPRSPARTQSRAHACGTSRAAIPCRRGHQLRVDRGSVPEQLQPLPGHDPLSWSRGKERDRNGRARSSDLGRWHARSHAQRQQDPNSATSRRKPWHGARRGWHHRVPERVWQPLPLLGTIPAAEHSRSSQCTSASRRVARAAFR